MQEQGAYENGVEIGIWKLWSEDGILEFDDVWIQEEEEEELVRRLDDE